MHDTDKIKIWEREPEFWSRHPPLSKCRTFYKLYDQAGLKIIPLPIWIMIKHATISIFQREIQALVCETQVYNGKVRAHSTMYFRLRTKPQGALWVVFPFLRLRFFFFFLTIVAHQHLPPSDLINHIPDASVLKVCTNGFNAITLATRHNKL